MRFIRFVLGPIIVLVLIAASYGDDTNLVDLAKKEKARRAQAGGTHKVFTNKDIEAYKTKNKQSSGKASTDQAQTQTAPAEDDVSTLDQQYDKEKEYWRGRYAAVKTRIEKAEKEVNRLQPIVDQLKETFVQSKDPSVVARFQEEVDDKTTELEQARKEVDAAQKAMDDLQEEGRKAGALPGWFRD